jgi:hypothetical protein
MSGWREHDRDGPPRPAPSAEWSDARGRKLAALRVPPPSPQRVARRLVGLAVGYQRGFIESGARVMVEGRPDAAEALLRAFEEAREAIIEWVWAEELLPDLSLDEGLAVVTETGRLPDEIHADLSWNGEAAVPLLWALGLLDAMPPYDWNPPTPPIRQHVPPRQSIPGFIGSAKLRAQAEIEAARNVAELWHWRARTTQLQREQPGHMVAGDWFRREVLANVARSSAERGDFPAAIDGDFPAFGKAYTALDEEQYGFCARLAQARHRALNWLCGYAERWDAVPTDT